MEQFPSSFCVGRTRFTSCKDDPSKVLVNFSPDLYLQRYAAVLSFLNRTVQNEDIRIITEYGANSFKFLYQSLEPVDWLETINLVDIDREALHSGIELIQHGPNNRTKSNRVKSLVARVFHGNMAYKDHRVIDSDVVIGIEVIEHMTPSDFDNFPRNVFGYIQPKYVVFTTPNRDFNVLFGLPEGKFRHYDHKFEFSQQEFSEWAKKIVKNYPSYEYHIYGIGPSDPDNDLDVGFASQMVIFKRRRRISNSRAAVELTDISCESYQLEATIILNPGDSRTQRQKEIDVISRRLWSVLRQATQDDHCIILRREWCTQGAHEMHVLPAKWLLKRLQNDFDVCTNVDTLMQAIHPSVTDITYDVELTIALGLVFVCRNDCDSYPHDESCESTRIPPGTSPPISFYSLVDKPIGYHRSNVLPDDALQSKKDHHRRIYHFAKHFLQSIVTKGLYLTAVRESCVYDHSMWCVTVPMILAYLQTEAIETDEETLLAVWNARAPKKLSYPIEVTAYGQIFIVRSSCPQKTPCLRMTRSSELELIPP